MSSFGYPVDQERISGQCSGRTGPIIRFVWHHQASTNDDATIGMMVSGSREVSATYTVDNKDHGGRGWSRITGVVPEAMRPWTSGSQMVDGQALTVECCNSSGDPEWGIAAESLEACARLAAYAYIQYGVPLRRITSSADGSGHIGHGEIVSVWPGHGYATFCPGNLSVDAIIERATVLLGGGYTPPAPTPPSGGNPHAGRPWPSYMPADQWFGDIDGPASSHGGYYDYERPDVQAIQDQLLAKGYVPGVSYPNGWADGLFEQPTADAVAAFQRAEMPGTQFYGQVWSDDWANNALSAS